MRILLLNQYPLEGSGSGIYTKHLAEYLVECGHDVCVLCPDNKKISNPKSFKLEILLCNEDDNEDYDYVRNFPSLNLHPQSSVLFSELSDEQLEDYIKAMDDKLRSVVKEFNPDIIHSQQVWVFASILSDIDCPYILSCNGNEIEYLDENSRYFDYSKKALTNAGKVIAASRYIYNKLLTLFDLPIEKVEMVPLGFKKEIFNSNKEIITETVKLLKLPDGFEKLVVFVGKLQDSKGLDILVKSARKVMEVLPDTIFAIAGEGDQREDMETLTRMLNLSNVYFLGYLPQNMIGKLYKIADLSICSSKNEPFGINIIESLACGTPVIGTNIGNIPDLISDKTGNVIVGEDPDALARAILDELLANSKAIKKEKAISFANEYFSWDIVMTNLIQAYENVLEF